MIRRDRLLRLLWAGPVALAVCYFALWACAPVFSQPAPVPIAAERNREIGLAGGHGYEADPNTGSVCVDFFHADCAGPQFQAYYRSRFRKVELAAMAQAGQISLIGGGMMVRGYFVDGPARVGLTGTFGFPWVALGVPVSGQLTPGFWLYTEPTAAVSTVGTLRLPVGLSLEVGQVGLGLEAGAATGQNVRGLWGYGAFRLSAAF